MKKTSKEIGYQNLAFAVLVSALEDSPRRFAFSKKTGKYQECNYQNRATAQMFFKTGRFRIWADMASFSYDVLLKAYREKREQKLYQDRVTKKWLPEMDLTEVAGN